MAKGGDRGKIKKIFKCQQEPPSAEFLKQILLLPYPSIWNDNLIRELLGILKT